MSKLKSLLSGKNCLYICSHRGKERLEYIEIHRESRLILVGVGQVVCRIQLLVMSINSASQRRVPLQLQSKRRSDTHDGHNDIIADIARADEGRVGRAFLARERSIRRERVKGSLFSRVQLTSSPIGNRTRLMPSLLKVVTINNLHLERTFYLFYVRRY